MENEEQTPPKDSAAARLGSFLEAHRDQKHAVVLQDYPDPDTISSAMAYATIAAQYGIKADTVYLGEVSHPENKALIRLLEIDLIAWNEELDLQEYQGAVFVDNQAVNTALWPKLKKAGVKPLAIVDHHSP